MWPRIAFAWQIAGQLAALLLGALFVALDLSGVASNTRWEILWLLFFGCFVLATLYREADRFMRARPNIVLNSCFVDQRPWVDMNTGDQLAILYFAHAEFKNEPRLREPEASADNVVAHMDYLDEDSESRLISIDIYGRWADKKQPSLRGPFGSTRDLIPTTFEVSGLPHTLTLVAKHPDEDICYAWDNELPRQADLHRDWRYIIRAKRFRIRVHLTGQRVDKQWSFTVRNLGGGSGLEVQDASDG